MIFTFPQWATGTGGQAVALPTEEREQTATTG